MPAAALRVTHEHPVDADVGMLNANRLHARMKEGHDPFGFGRHRSFPTTSEVRHVLVDALLGADPALRERLETAARSGLAGVDGPLMGPDAITVDMLVHCGIDPLAFAVIGALHGTYDVRQTAGGSSWAHHGPIIKIKPHGDERGLHWHDTGTIFLPRLPATVGMMTGARLSEIVSHPVLDRHVCIVTDVITQGLAGRSMLEVAFDRTPQDAERLVEARLPWTDRR